MRVTEDNLQEGNSFADEQEYLAQLFHIETIRLKFSFMKWHLKISGFAKICEASNLQFANLTQPNVFICKTIGFMIIYLLRRRSVSRPHTVKTARP